MKPSPLTVRVKAGPPAMADVGLMDEMTGETVLTVKLTGFELATPGVDTVIGATPSVATRLTGMVAVNWVELTKTVGNGVRTHRTVDAEVKRSPVTVRFTAGPPAAEDEGSRLMMVLPNGFGPMTSLMALEAAAPGFLTWMPISPASCARAAGTVAVKKVESM